MQFLQGNNLPRVKASNQSAILRMIYYYGPLQRAEIAERLGLTLPTITTNINKMLADSLVREMDAPDMVGSTNGRRARLLGINPDACYFVGVEFRFRQWNICVTDFCGRIIASKGGYVKDDNYENTMRKLSEGFLECLSDSRKTQEELCGVGICLPGLVDRENGVLKVYARQQWSNKRICEDFIRLTGYQGRVTMENSATARGMGAQLFHWDELKNDQIFAYMVVSTGIACPVFLNTSSYRGSVVGAGEAGHMIIDPHGRPCNCGNRGCLEAYASEEAIRNDCRKAMEQGRASLLRTLCADPKHPRISEIMEAQEAGDEDVCHILEDAIYMMSIGVNNIINFTRPDVMLIDCKLFGNKTNRHMLLSKAQNYLNSPAYSNTEISFVEGDRLVGALGAVAVAIDEKLEHLT